MVGVPCVTVTLNVVSSSRSTVRAMAMSQYSSGELLMWLRGLQPVLPASPQKPSTADRDGVPLNPPRGGFQVDHRKPELPIRIGDVARVAPAHREILDAEQHPPVHRCAGMGTEAVGMALKYADAFVLDQRLGRKAAMHRDLVPVTDIK